MRRHAATFFPLILSVLIISATSLILLIEASYYLLFYIAWSIVFVGIYCYISYFACRGIEQCQLWDKVDWAQKWRASTSHEGSSETWNSIRHFLLIPNYYENIDLLEDTLRNLASCELATQIVVVLAMEEKEINAREKAAVLTARFVKKFANVICTYHPEKLSGELPGKASNVKWATEQLLRSCEMKDDIQKVLLHVCDADSRYHVRYFSCLNYCFLTAPLKTRHHTIWQSPLVHYTNYSSLFPTTRPATVTTTLHELAALSNARDPHIPFSTYALSLALVEEVGGFDGDVIAEDSHMFLKCYYESAGGCVVEPIFLPTLGYSVTGKSAFGALRGRACQGARHAMAVMELSYALLKVLEKRQWTVTSLAILGKLISLHIITTYQAMAHLIALAAWWCMEEDRHSFSYISPFSLSTLVAVNLVVGISMTGLALANHRLLRLLLQTKRLPAVCRDDRGQGKDPYYMTKGNGYSLLKHSCWVALELLSLGQLQTFLFYSVPEFVASFRILYLESFEYHVASKITT